MGGAVSKAGQLVGIVSKNANNAVQESVGNKPEEKTTTSTVSKSQEEEAARMRASRRRGRQLLSDARLNPEGGVQTLGGGSNLG